MPSSGFRLGKGVTTQRDVGCTPTACLHHFPGSPASSQGRGGGRGIRSRVLQHPPESCRQSPDVCTAQAPQGRVAVRRSPGRTQHPFGGWPAPCPWTQALSWVLREVIPSAGILCALRCWGHPGQEESCLPRRAGCGTHGVHCKSLLRGRCSATGDILKAATAEQSRGQGLLRAAGRQPGASWEGSGARSVSRTGRLGRGKRGLCREPGGAQRGCAERRQEAQAGGLSPSSHGPATPGGS